MYKDIHFHPLLSNNSLSFYQNFEIFMSYLPCQQVAYSLVINDDYNIQMINGIIRVNEYLVQHTRHKITIFSMFTLFVCLAWPWLFLNSIGFTEICDRNRCGKEFCSLQTSRQKVEFYTHKFLAVRNNPNCKV